MNSAGLLVLLAEETATYESRTPHSRRLFGEADHLFGRVPMTWMNKWSGGYPIYLAQAHGNRIVDVDGHEYVDFALGDTAAMAGHSPRPTIEAVQRRIGESGGITTMMPSVDAEWVAAELTRRFGLPLWSFTLSATDANRWALRLARMATGRSKVLSFAYCYHGSVDETFAVRDGQGRTVIRSGGVGAPIDITQTSRSAEFNDLASVEEALRHGDVAVCITEPALTNIGIVLPLVSGIGAYLGTASAINGTTLFFAVAAGVTDLLASSAAGVAVHAHLVVPAKMAAMRLARQANAVTLSPPAGGK